jgi:hypothetical protein
MPLPSNINISLDPSLYGLDPAALEFFQQQTGITNEDDLKHHILAVQAKAFAVSDGFRRCRSNFMQLM